MLEFRRRRRVEDCASVIWASAALVEDEVVVDIVMMKGLRVVVM